MVNPTKLIDAVIDAPHIVEVSPKDKTVKIPVRCELRNNSEHDYVLHSPNKDHQSFWHVMDENHRELHREKGPGKGGAGGKKDDFRAITIASGHSNHEVLVFKLKVNQLRDGQAYTIRGESWGQIAEATFFVVKKEKDSSPRRKKVTRKKTTKKKASKKKRANEKAVKKKVTRKKARTIARKKKVTKKKVS